MPDTWNAENYLKFTELRTRSAKDLLASLPEEFNPKTVHDLGCGPGNSTVLLKKCFGNAQVYGLDDSASMLNQARLNHSDINFIECDISQYTPADGTKVDLIFANSALQWVKNHHKLLPNLVNALNMGGIIAIQMPNNFHLPNHQIIVELLRGHPKWSVLLASLRYGELKQPFFDCADYYRTLTTAGLSKVDCWQTDYFHVMDSHAQIFDFAQSTALSPVLPNLNTSDQIKFKQLYIKALSKHYPPQTDGKILLKFTRMFVVGYK